MATAPALVAFASLSSLLSTLASAPALVLLALIFLAALGVALVLTPTFRTAAFRFGWVDIPDARKIHTVPVPRVGGIAIFAGLTAGLALAYLVQDGLPFDIPPRTWAVWGGALVLFATGLYDDIHGLGFKRKFAVQLVVAYFMVAAGFHFRLDGVPFIENLSVYHQLWIALPFTLLWIVGIINAINLLDGLDGLAGGISMVALLALAVAFASNGDIGMVVLALALAGGLVGFLVFNFNPASIFMGDSGSLVLGFLLAMYSIQGTGHADPLLALLVPVIALGLPIMDTSVTFFRRIAQRRSPFMPDGDHIHHRVRRSSASHRRAVLVLYGVGMVFGITAVLIASGGMVRAAVLLVGLVAFVYALLRFLGYVRLSKTVRRLYVRRLLRRRAAERVEPTPPRVAQRHVRRERPTEALAEAS
ncbi:MAG: MraY family glycosyltransferase [Bacteroidota bacterium]